VILFTVFEIPGYYFSFSGTKYPQSFKFVFSASEI
jgi:hypothetical protein